MEPCLYGAPEQGIAGYYTRPQEQFGKGGDFYTSSDVHAVFGRLLARQFLEMWQAMGSPASLELIELGPGRGLFAQDVLDGRRRSFGSSTPPFATRWWKAPRPCVRVLRNGSRSGLLRAKQRLLDGIEQAAAGGEFIVFGNEFLDALPVEIVSSEGQLHIRLGRGPLLGDIPSSAATGSGVSGPV